MPPFIANAIPVRQRDLRPRTPFAEVFCDLEFVAQTMQDVAAEVIGPDMMKHVRVYRELLARTPVDRLTVQEKPVVLFRVSENTWLEAIVRYLVDPKRAGRVKTDLLGKLLARLNAEPNRVMFPKSDAQ